jgi:hypothetical protein
MKKLLIIALLLLLVIFINGINRGFSDDITIIAIDKETVEQIGPYPFSRDKYADFIDLIYSEYSPKCVYFNLLIYQYQKGSMESDTLLFNAINGKQNIFFSAKVSDTKVDPSYYKKSQFNEFDFKRTWVVKGAIFPLKDLAQNGAFASISDVGLNNNAIVVSMPTVVQIDNNKYLSTPLFLTITYLDIAPQELFSGRRIEYHNKKIKTDRNGWFEIEFNHEFAKYSYNDIMNKKVKKEFIDQRIIMFGIDYPELENYLLVNDNKAIAGVEVIANATQTMIDQLR